MIAQKEVVESCGRISHAFHKQQLTCNVIKPSALLPTIQLLYISLVHHLRNVVAAWQARTCLHRISNEDNVFAHPSPLHHVSCLHFEPIFSAIPRDNHPASHSLFRNCYCDLYDTFSNITIYKLQLITLTLNV